MRSPHRPREFSPACRGAAERATFATLGELSEMPDRIDEAAVRAAVAEFKDPETGRSVVQMEQVRDLRATADEISLTLALTTHSAPLWKETKQELVDLLRQRFAAAKRVDVELVVHPRPAPRQGELGLTVKSIIAVGSGKGGVGKSTIAASIALGLA